MKEMEHSEHSLYGVHDSFGSMRTTRFKYYCFFWHGNLYANKKLKLNLKYIKIVLLLVLTHKTYL